MNDVVDAPNLRVEVKEHEAAHDEELATRIDDFVVNRMTELLERVRVSVGRTSKDVVGLQVEWYNKVNPQPGPVSLSTDPSRLATDVEELRRALELKAILEPTSLLLRKIAGCIAKQLESCKKQISALECRSGFSSLPDELLILVLEDALYNPQIERSCGGALKAHLIIGSVNDAVKISAVCQRFRRLAIARPSFWNRVCVGMSHAMLITCVERAGTAGLHVFFDIQFLLPVLSHGEPREALTRPFLEFMLSYSDNWQQFDYHCFPYLCLDASFPVGEMENLEATTNSLHVPQLSNLRIGYDVGKGDDFYEINPALAPSDWKKTFHYYSTWSMPSLRTMSTVNLIPIKFGGCATIESLSIDMNYSRSLRRVSSRPFDARGLSAFLGSCPVLKDLTLRLTHATVLSDERLSEEVTSNVESLDLHLDWCSSRSVRYLLDTVRFPHVARMKLTVICNEDVSDVDRIANNNLRAIFPNSRTFPRLTRLQFIAHCNKVQRSGTDPRPTCFVELPIHNMPSLEDLYVTSRGVVIEPVVKSLTMPTRLSSVTIDDCDSSVWTWLAELKRLFKAQGREESLRVAPVRSQSVETGAIDKNQGLEIGTIAESSDNLNSPVANTNDYEPGDIEKPNLTIEDNHIGFVDRLLELIKSSTGGQLADLLYKLKNLYDNANPHSDPVVLSYDLSRKRIDSDELRRATAMKAVLETPVFILQPLSDRVVSQLEGCENQIATLRYRIFFSSIPDGIFSRVLENAAHVPRAENTLNGGDLKAQSIIKSFKASTKISSVCSLFRRVAIRSPGLWNHVCVGMPQEMLLACAERAGTTGFHVYYDISILGLRIPEPRETLMHPFLEFVVPLAKLWRGFDYHLFPFLSSGAPHPTGEIVHFDRMTNELCAPLLSDLSIRNQESEFGIFPDVDPDTLHYYSTWDLPNLRSMSTLNLIPISFSGTKSITSLSINMNYSIKRHQKVADMFDVIGLAEFISLCPVLKKLSLRLKHATVHPDTHFTGQLAVTGVAKLELYLDWCSPSSMQYFLRAVRFPSVTSVVFTVVCHQDMSEADRYADNSVQTVFSSPDVFPRLERLQFMAHRSRPDSRHYTEAAIPGDSDPSLIGRGWHKPTRTVGIPVHNMPNLKYLNINLEQIAIHPMIDAAIPVHLSEVYIGDCGKSMSVWLGQLLLFLAEQGRLHSLKVISKHPVPRLESA